MKRYEFRTQLARQMFTALKERGIRRGKTPIHIWVSDEARFGLQASLRRAWVTRGVRAHKNSSIRYDWQYIWGLYKSAVEEVSSFIVTQPREI